MSRRNSSIFALLIALPWWFSIIAAGIAYSVVTLVLPYFAVGDLFLESITNSLAPYALFFAAFFLVPAPISYLIGRKKRKILDNQKGIQSVRELSWAEFESLIGEMYRRQGFAVKENDSAGPDGGIDLVLRKSGIETLVQCKQWRSTRIGVPIVREMYGILSASRASKVIVITSGHFTQEALNFSKGKPIKLIDGNALVPLLKEVQKKPVAQSNNDSFDNNVVNPSVEPTIAAVHTEPNWCPKCGSDMVLRTAKKGPNSGKQFHGCSGFPKCRYIEQTQ